MSLEKILNRQLRAFLLIMGSLAAYDVLAEPDQLYIGAGGGLTFLEPNTNSVALTLSEDGDIGFKLFGGYQIDDNWAVEAFWSQMGQAEISSGGAPLGTIDYSAFGIGGTYFYALDEEWNMFAKAGYGQLDNTAAGVAFERVNDSLIYIGGGVSWKMKDTLSLRAEYEVLDTDAQMLSLSLVKRFGTESTETIVKRALERYDIQQQQRDDVTTAIEQDADRDGVLDVNDDCPGSERRVWVDESGCSRVDEVIAVLYFDYNSVRLGEQKDVLDGLLPTLSEMPDGYRIEINAYTDTDGTSLYNFALSQSRAHTVRRYLNSNGIELGDMDANGFGEWHPLVVSDDQSSDQNRRVEIIVVRD